VNGQQSFLTKTRTIWFLGFSAFAALVSSLFIRFGRLDPGQILPFGWVPVVLVALYVALQAGERDMRRRWVAFAALALAGALLSAWLVSRQGLVLWRVLVHGMIPLLLFGLVAVFAGRRVAPFRLVQIFSFAALNGYILAYLQNKILFSGFLKRIPEPILNCYGGPLAFFACPIGSFQQMLSQPNPTVAAFFDRLAGNAAGFLHSAGKVLAHLPWLPLGVFVVIGALVGRAACGWLCPFGLWQDLLYKVKAGPKAGWKRWLTLAVIALLSLYVSLLLVRFLHVVWWKPLVFGWLPFMAAVSYVVVRGKMDLPRRLWLGGWLAGVLIGVLAWFKFEPSFGIVAGVLGMTVLGFCGGWYALALALPAAFFAVVLGPGEFRVGPLAGAELGLVAALLAGLFILVLDRLVRVKLPSTLLKYAFLLLVAGFVAYKTAEPWFCKLCPQGTLGAGLPLVLWDPVGGLRDLVGWLYYVKVGILLAVVVAAMAVKRPFCRVVCPIGAIYAIFNKASLLHMKLDKPTCTGCNICRKVCPMDIEPQQGPNQLECIRCFECRWKCPKSSLRIRC